MPPLINLPENTDINVGAVKMISIKLTLNRTAKESKIELFKALGDSLKTLLKSGKAN